MTPAFSSRRKPRRLNTQKIVATQTLHDARSAASNARQRPEVAISVFTHNTPSLILYYPRFATQRILVPNRTHRLHENRESRYREVEGGRQRQTIAGREDGPLHPRAGSEREELWNILDAQTWCP